MRVVVKLGGSLITDKGKAFFARDDIIRAAAQAIRESAQLGAEIILIHGGGSFGHVAAKKEIDRFGKLTAASVPPVSRAMMVLNNHVMEALLDENLKAVSFPPHSFCLYSCSKDSFSCSFDSLLIAFNLKIIPVTFGDIVFGEEACEPAIISGDDLALVLAKKVNAERVVFATNVDGVYRELEDASSLIPHIEFSEIPKLLEQIKITGGGVTDVTKGLPGKLTKIYRYLSSHDKRPEVAIINGMRKETLKMALSGSKVQGTFIT